MYHFLTNTSSPKNKSCINNSSKNQIDNEDTYVPRLELSQLSLYSEVNQPSSSSQNHTSSRLETSLTSTINQYNPFSPRPSTGRTRKAKSTSKSTPKSHSKSTTRASSAKGSTSARISKAAGEQLQISQQYTEPYFELTGEFSYGCAEKSTRSKKSNCDGNNNFTPDAKQLKKEGGKSIKLYENWRIMQYHQNVVMKKFLSNHGINGSVLPPCTSFDMWKDSKWRELYRQATGNGLDQDPCPDCDVRFFKDGKIANKYSYKIAPASLLNNTGWKRRKFLNTIFVIGLPQHITVACCREFADHVVFEFFDPAGAGGDTVSIKAVKEWTQSYLKDKYSSLRHEKPVLFTQVCKTINCQADKADVMCQTWIWWWVYWRMIRQATIQELTKHLKQLVKRRQTLSHITSFKQWLINLYNLNYVQRECAYERRAAIANSPPSKLTLQRMKDHNLQNINITSSLEFCLNCKSNQKLPVSDGLCRDCEEALSRATSCDSKCVTKTKEGGVKTEPSTFSFVERHFNYDNLAQQQQQQYQTQSEHPSKISLIESTCSTNTID